MTVLSEVLMLDSEQFNPKKMKRDQLLNAILDKVGADDQDWLCKVRNLLPNGEAQSHWRCVGRIHPVLNSIGGAARLQRSCR